MLSLGSDRAQQLSENGTFMHPRWIASWLTFSDGLIADIIDRIPSSSKYTLLYVTSPREFPESDSVVLDFNEDSYQNPIHMEIKRDYSSHTGGSDSSDRVQSLFDEYQYFTPGSYPTRP